MAIISRPGKEGNATTYQGKVAAGYTNILAQEVDADIDAIFTAWNQGVDTVNIKPGAVGPAQLAPGAIGSASLGVGSVTSAAILDGTIQLADLSPAVQAPLQGQFGSLVTVNPRGALYGGPGSVDVHGNTSGDPAYDNTHASWLIQLDYTNDIFRVSRAAPGSSTFVALVFVTADGHLGCVLTDGSVTRSQIVANAVAGANAMVPNPTGFVTTATTWTTVVTLPTITTRGGWVHLHANHGLSVFGTVGGALCNQRWTRGGVPINGASWSFNIASQAGMFVPFPGIHFIDSTAPAGANTYAYQVQCGVGCQIESSSQADGSFSAWEIG